MEIIRGTPSVTWQIEQLRAIEARIEKRLSETMASRDRFRMIDDIREMQTLLQGVRAKIRKMERSVG